MAELVAQLSAPDAPSRASAAWALAGAGEVDETVAGALMAALEDPSAPVREAATWSLSHLTGSAVRRVELMDAPPKLLVQTRPSYPRSAYKQKLHGTVLVMILINELGRVAHAEIRGSIPLLDEAALACVRDWVFEPAKRAGRPVPCVAQAPVSFTLY